MPQPDAPGQISFKGNDAPSSEVQNEILQNLDGHLPPNYSIKWHCYRWGRYRCWIIKDNGGSKAEQIGFHRQLTFDIHLGQTTWHVLLSIVS